MTCATTRAESCKQQQQGNIQDSHGAICNHKDKRIDNKQKTVNLALTKRLSFDQVILPKMIGGCRHADQRLGTKLASITPLWID